MYQNKLWTSFFISFAIAAITCPQTFTLPKIEPKLLQEDFQIARTALGGPMGNFMTSSMSI